MIRILLADAIRGRFVARRRAKQYRHLIRHGTDDGGARAEKHAAERSENKNPARSALG